jgi:hypothetical protein
MAKHKTDKKSKDMNIKSNKAGQAPQAPKIGSTAQNQYR